MSNVRPKFRHIHTMKKTLCLVIALFAFAFHSPASAGESKFPEKNPVLRYELPAGWESEVDEKDGSISLNAKSGAISVNFAPVALDASLEVFEKLLPDMVKALGEGSAVVDKPKEHTEDGLTGYMATYSATIEGKPAMAVMVLFKGGKEQAVLGNIIVADPEKLSKEDNEAFAKFMQSMKGAAK